MMSKRSGVSYLGAQRMFRVVIMMGSPHAASKIQQASLTLMLLPLA